MKSKKKEKKKHEEFDDDDDDDQFSTENISYFKKKIHDLDEVTELEFISQQSLWTVRWGRT